MAAIRILVVCTANVCRSPMAAALLTRHLADAGIAAVVASAGTHATDLPVDPQAVAVMADLGLDVSGHTPRQITREGLVTQGADLIITMTRQHLREVVVADRATWPRSFTLRELVRGAAGRGGGSPGLGEWLAEVGAERRPADLLGGDPHDDVDDPYGLALAVVRRTADEIDHLTRALVALMPGPRSEDAKRAR